MAPVRVLVVEDSPTVRARLCEALRADPAIELVGQATDGKQAIELCAALRPDVVTMDMVLPVMSGLAATEYIMSHHPTPRRTLPDLMATDVALHVHVGRHAHRFRDRVLAGRGP